MVTLVVAAAARACVVVVVVTWFTLRRGPLAEPLSEMETLKSVTEVGCVYVSSVVLQLTMASDVMEVIESGKSAACDDSWQSRVAPSPTMEVTACVGVAVCV